MKQATDIVDLIGTCIPLQRAGSSLRALCPFHEEKTPSFHVFPQSQLFRCFGCNAAGDAITFVERFQNLAFREALEWLAERAGIQLSRGPARDASGVQRKTVYQALDAACSYFEGNLKRAPKALLEALDRRGLTEEVRAAWRLGLAPTGWQTLHERLSAAGMPPDVQIAAGLVKRQESGRIHDRFRDRVTFPICDILGRVVAFGARLLPGVEEGAENGPKYLNSPESEIFQKRKILYGLDKFPRAQQNEKGGEIEPVAVMEGYTDVILAHKAGMRRAVATLGTALGRDHAHELRRHSPRVLLLYDGDEAGLRASERGVGILLEEGLEVRVAALPDEMDPADYVLAHGGPKFLAAVGAGVEFLEFLGARIRARGVGLGGPEDRARACDEVLSYVVKIDSPIQRELWVRKIASWFSVSESRVSERLAGTLAAAARAAASRARYGQAASRDVASEPAETQQSNSQDSAPQLSARDRQAAEELLGALLREPAFVSLVVERGFEAKHLREARFVALLGAMLDIAAEGGVPDVHAVTDRLGEVSWRSLPASLQTGAPKNAEEAVVKALEYFERIPVEVEIRELKERILLCDRQAHGEVDRGGALALERRLLELHRLLRDGSRRVRGSFGEPPSERSAAPEPSVASEPLEEAVSVPRFAETAAETSADPHFARIEFPVSEAVPDDPHGGFGLEEPLENDGAS